MLSAKGRGSRPTGVKEATVLFHAALGRGSCTKGRGVGRGQAAETAGMEGEGTTGAGRPAWGVGGLSLLRESPRGAASKPPRWGAFVNTPPFPSVGVPLHPPQLRAGLGEGGGEAAAASGSFLPPPTPGSPPGGQGAEGGGGNRGGAGPGAPGPGGGRQPPFLRAASGTQTFAPNFYSGFYFIFFFFFGRRLGIFCCCCC